MTSLSPGPALVTGAAGFIGSRLALALRSDGTEVRALVRPHHDVRQLEAAEIEIVRGDAAHDDTVRDAARGCEVIFHLAAARGPLKLGYRDYRTRNRRLSEVIGRAALGAGVRRVVTTSAATVTGYAGPDRQTEETPPRPNTAYRSSRVEAERVFERLGREDGLDVVTVRVPHRVMGPGARPWAKLARGVRDGTIRVVPRGGSVHAGDVDDIVDGLRLCAVTEGIAGRRFLIAAPEPMPTPAMLRAIAGHLDVSFTPRMVPAAPYRAYVALGNAVYRVTKRSLPHHFTAEFYSARVALDIGRARRELGFEPRYDMSEGVRRTITWLRDHDLV